MNNPNQLMIAKRIDYMDILKAIAIITVVMGHAGTPGTSIIYMFHMPLFFFISGYFYKDEYSEDPIKLFKKRLQSLYLPFIKYEFIFLVLHNLLYKFSLYNDRYLLKDYITNTIKILFFDGTDLLLAPFWFLTALFITTMLFCLICYAVKHYFHDNEIIKFTIIVILFCLGIFLSYCNVNLRYSSYGKEVINVSLVATLIFYFGYNFKKYEVYFKINFLLAVCCFIFLCINQPYNNGFDMRINLYPSPAFMVFSSICGIYLMIFLSKKVTELGFARSLLKYIGQNTIIVMAFHILSFKLVGLIQLKLYKLPLDLLKNFPVVYDKHLWWVAYTIVGVVLPIIYMYLIDSCKLFLSNKLRIRNASEI